jgi:hypothetical protein
MMQVNLDLVIESIYLTTYASTALITTVSRLLRVDAACVDLTHGRNVSSAMHGFIQKGERTVGSPITSAMCDT